jgi:3'-phosphoadenosine 5'-phosphosulfate sulfotransferase (PAPS reductase)/FAD synthetase
VSPRGSKIVVSLSGSKDSIACLLLALEEYGPELVIAHHQVIPEDWPGTVEYNQQVCSYLGVPLYTAQAHYYGYECEQCLAHYLTSNAQPYCRACKSREGRQVALVQSLLDLVTWRGMWPSLDVRFCTSYLKRDVFNMWARRNSNLLGSSSVVVMGERWRESKGRARLPYIRQRTHLPHMTEYRPILDYRRIDVFRKSREYGIEPHYCYKAQGMTDEDMYEWDVEGGPRMSCVICFLKPEVQLKASYQTEQGRPIVERGIAVERAIGHRPTRDHSLEAAVSG